MRNNPLQTEDRCSVTAGMLSDCGKIKETLFAPHLGVYRDPGVPLTSSPRLSST